MAVTELMIMAAVAAGPIGSSPFPQNYASPAVHSTTLVERNHLVALRQLRTQALSEQAADGGSLSAGHRAALQVRLDRLNADYARAYHNADRSRPNSDGYR